MNRGSAYQKRGDSSRALEDYEKALLVTPESIIQDEGTPPAFTAEEFKSIRYLILHECGVLYLEKGDKERAMEFLNEFLIDTPDEYSYEKRSVSIALVMKLS